ncbi:MULTISPECIES: pyridoxal-phosphate dependent enzyme, partial [pseudomallei group]
MHLPILDSKRNSNPGWTNALIVGAAVEWLVEAAEPPGRRAFAANRATRRASLSVCRRRPRHGGFAVRTVGSHSAEAETAKVGAIIAVFRRIHAFSRLLMASHDYLKKILTARVYDVALETELERARNLSARLNNAVYLKREDNQPVFSFKLRGAYNKMAHIPADALARGVITASA